MKRAITPFLLAIPLTLGAVACGGSTEPTEVAPATDVTLDAKTLDKVAKAARAIKKDPSKTDEILKKAGDSRAEFEGILYLIAGDPDASKKYAKIVQ